MRVVLEGEIGFDIQLKCMGACVRHRRITALFHDRPQVARLLGRAGSRREKHFDGENFPAGFSPGQSLSYTDFVTLEG